MLQLVRRIQTQQCLLVFCRRYGTSRPIDINLSAYSCDLIRNFSIIAHIDHGKSTLADRLLELTNTIPTRKTSCTPVLDKLKVEQERGITVKAQTSSMLHEYKGQKYLLNLIDTPGHVDFAWEVDRSMAACTGALLLVDATQGVQAQTLQVFRVARSRGVKIIPILNKIDLPAADPARVIAQMSTSFGINEADVLWTSSKTGQGVAEVLDAIVERIPPPSGFLHDPFKALLFDSSYDRYRGVVSLISVQGGALHRGDKIVAHHSKKRYEITDLGIMYPEEVSTPSLQVGQVGYIVCNMKESVEAQIGDTIYRVGEPVEPLPTFQPTKPMVYAGVFPLDSNDFAKLEESIKRLTLTDRSVTIQRESSAALGQGSRLGFLGTLHMDVFRQRLEDEYDANVIITAPTVPFRVLYKDGTHRIISNPTDFPDRNDPKVIDVQEPFTSVSIIVPQEYLGDMMELCSRHRAEQLDFQHVDLAASSARVLLRCQMPLNEIVRDFFEQLKSRSSGYASFDYEDAGYVSSDLSKMTLALNGKSIDALAMVVHRTAQEKTARAWVKKLREVIPRQLFEVPIQALVGTKVIARETLSAIRKDVTAGLYGGHFERKMKHLEKQKESKKKMKRMGNIDLPQEAFFQILQSKP